MVSSNETSDEAMVIAGVFNFKTPDPETLSWSVDASSMLAVGSGYVSTAVSAMVLTLSTVSMVLAALGIVLLSSVVSKVSVI